MAQLIIAFAVLAAITWLVVREIRILAERRQVFDIPNQRSSHTYPIPRGGGLAIAAICLVGWFGLILFHPDENRFGMASFGVGATMIASISFLDDLKNISSAVRFSVHGVAAILLVLGYGSWNTVVFPLVGNIAIGWLGIPLMFLWIVGLTNAYNFMDGIDGIATCQAVVAGLGWMLLERMNIQKDAFWLALFVTATSIGFLVHNWHPAKIFMGDVGSVTLGYTFAFFAIKAGQDHPRMILAGILLVWPFVFDSTFTFLRRLMKRENVFAAHRSHLYQRLVIAEWSHSATTLLYAFFDLVGMILAVLFVSGRPEADWLVAIVIPALAVSLWIIVVHQESNCKRARCHLKR